MVIDQRRGVSDHPFLNRAKLLAYSGTQKANAFRPTELAYNRRPFRSVIHGRNINRYPGRRSILGLMGYPSSLTEKLQPPGVAGMMPVQVPTTKQVAACLAVWALSERQRPMRLHLRARCYALTAMLLACA